MQLDTNMHSDKLELSDMSSWTCDLLLVNVLAHKYRSSHWMEVLYVQGHLYLVCLSENTSSDRAGIKYQTFPLQHAASCSTGLQKAPLLLEEMHRYTSLWSLVFDASSHFQVGFVISECHFWCHFCLWFCLAVWGFFLLPILLITFWLPVVFI